MISSTKPSSPTKAFKRLAASTFVSRRAAECSRNSPGSIEKLIELYSDDLEDAIEIVIVEEADFERSFALFVTQLDLGAEALSQPVLQIGNVRTRSDRFSVRGTIAW